MQHLEVSGAVRHIYMSLGGVNPMERKHLWKQPHSLMLLNIYRSVLRRE